MIDWTKVSLPEAFRILNEMSNIDRKDSWGQLSLYESRDLLSRFYQERRGRKLGAENAYEIMAHLAQGREYFANARQSSELARPLLLYYGVYALSRGLILFLTNLRETGLPSSHGIVAKDWHHALSQGRNHLPNIKQLPNLSLTITDGTFSVLTKATSNIERFYTLSFEKPIPSLPGTLVSRVGTTEIKNPATITIKMVLERLVDLGTLFATTFEHSPKYFKAELRSSREEKKEELWIILDILNTEEVLNKNNIHSVLSLSAD